MNWIDHYVTIYWKRVGEAVNLPEKSLGLLRWVYGFYVFLFAAPTFSWISQVPDGFFDPPLLSLAYLLDGFPPGWIFQWLDIFVLSAVFLVTIGVKARLFTVVLLIIKIFGLSFAYSLGKIDHGILENALLLCMIIAGWGRHYALLPDKKLKFESTRRGLSLFATLICFGMFSAGIIKLLFWVDFDLSTSGFLTWYYSSYYNLDYQLLLMPYVKNLPMLFYELADYTAVLFEVSGFLMLLWSPKAWKLWILVASLFHFSNTLVLNIPFLEHVIVYLAFVNFQHLFGNVIQGREKILSVAISLLFLSHIIQRVVSTGAEILFINDYQVHLVTNVYSGVGLWILTALLLFWEFKKASYQKVNP